MLHYAWFCKGHKLPCYAQYECLITAYLITCWASSHHLHCVSRHDVSVQAIMRFWRAGYALFGAAGRNNNSEAEWGSVETSDDGAHSPLKRSLETEKKGWFKSQNGSRILEDDNEKHKKLQQSVYSVFWGTFRELGWCLANQIFPLCFEWILTASGGSLIS